MYVVKERLVYITIITMMSKVRLSDVAETANRLLFDVVFRGGAGLIQNERGSGK